MSGIGKAVKKVFRGVKKVVKKIAKPALILGATFFVSGLATGGFKGFSNLLNGNPANIFKAVGQTIGLGAQAVGGMLGLTEGVSADMAAAYGNADLEGQYLFDGLLGQRTTADVITDTGEKIIKDTAEESARGGILGWFSRQSQPIQTAMLSGIGNGLAMWAQSEEAEKERKRQRKQAIFGVPIGEEFGSGISPEQIYAQFSSPANAPQMPGPQTMPTPQQAGFANPYMSQPSQPPAPRQPLLG